MIIAVNFPISAIGKKKPEKIRASEALIFSGFFFPIAQLNWKIYCDDHSSLSTTHFGAKLKWQTRKCFCRFVLHALSLSLCSVDKKDEKTQNLDA